MDRELPALLVVDDDSERLQALAGSLRQALDPQEVEVREWEPTKSEDPLIRFNSEISRSVQLVATDQDLTRSGTGLLGTSIASWAQDSYIPVCNF